MKAILILLALNHCDAIRRETWAHCRYPNVTGDEVRLCDRLNWLDVACQRKRARA